MRLYYLRYLSFRITRWLVLGVLVYRYVVILTTILNRINRIVTNVRHFYNVEKNIKWHGRITEAVFLFPLPLPNILHWFTFRTNFCQDLCRRNSDRIPVFSYLSSNTFRANSNAKSGRGQEKTSCKEKLKNTSYRDIDGIFLQSTGTSRNREEKLGGAVK